MKYYYYYILSVYTQQRFRAKELPTALTRFTDMLYFLDMLNTVTPPNTTLYLQSRQRLSSKHHYSLQRLNSVYFMWYTLLLLLWLVVITQDTSCQQYVTKKRVTKLVVLAKCVFFYSVYAVFISLPLVCKNLWQICKFI